MIWKYDTHKGEWYCKIYNTGAPADLPMGTWWIKKNIVCNYRLQLQYWDGHVRYFGESFVRLKTAKLVAELIQNGK